MAKTIFKGVSWRNPVLNLVFHSLDSLDALVRRTRRLSHLPPYSTRVRSNGVTKQFGGKSFAYYGKLIRDLLQYNTSLNSRSQVLEIGCGCGRTAIALAEILEKGNYTGMDIEEVALRACLDNRILVERQFRFDLLDIYNAEYNPSGGQPASSYVFPYPENSFDVVFLVSVFTHMLPTDVSNYIKEIGRVLRPGGYCMLTTFLVDYGSSSDGRFSFPYRGDGYYYRNESMPEVAVGYDLSFFESEFKKHDLFPSHPPILGSWRNESQTESTSGFPQDILFFSASQSR